MYKRQGLGLVGLWVGEREGDFVGLNVGREVVGFREGAFVGNGFVGFVGELVRSFEFVEGDLVGGVGFMVGEAVVG